MIKIFFQKKNKTGDLKKVPSNYTQRCYTMPEKKIITKWTCEKKQNGLTIGLTTI